MLSTFKNQVMRQKSTSALSGKSFVLKGSTKTHTKKDQALHTKASFIIESALKYIRLKDLVMADPKQVAQLITILLNKHAKNNEAFLPTEQVFHDVESVELTYLEPYYRHA